MEYANLSHDDQMKSELVYYVKKGGILFILIGGIIVVILTIIIADRIALRKRKAKLKAEFGVPPKSRLLHDTIPDYWLEFSSHNPKPNYIDSTTWNDLDMDAVFKRIDNCKSSVGEEYLYAALHAPAEQASLDDGERLCEFFKENESLRIEAQLALNKLGVQRNNGLWLLLFRPQLFSLKNPRRYTIQALLPLLGIPLLFFNVQIGLAVLVFTLGANFVTYYKVQRKTEHTLESISYLLKTIRCAKRLKKILKGSSPSTPEICESLDRSIAKLEKLNLSSFLLTVSPSSDAEAIVSFLGMLTLLPVVQYCKAIRLLAADNSLARELFTSVGAIDAAISIASFKESLPYYSKPSFTEVLVLYGEAIYHPLLEEPVANDVEIRKSLLLTGSNASGKSTYIKAIAINALLAQTLNICCARSFTLKPAPIITSMGVADNIVGGESYFVVEVKSMKRIVSAAAAGWEFYGFIDEILKGTNTTERIAASAAVLRFLHKNDCISVAATHDLELTEILRATYLNRHFSEQITDEGMLFDYKVKEGPSQSKNAIKLLSFFEYPAEIVSGANSFVEELEK